MIDPMTGLEKDLSGLDAKEKAKVLARMERHGVLLDLALLGELSREFGGKLLDAEAKAHAQAGQPFNLNSPKQIQEILFERQQLPPALLPHRKKIFGLTIDPQRLAQIRNERRPNSRYASLENCRQEIHEAEAMMRREGIRWLSTTTKSIEEIATTILQEIRPERLVY